MTSYSDNRSSLLSVLKEELHYTPEGERFSWGTANDAEIEVYGTEKRTLKGSSLAPMKVNGYVSFERAAGDGVKCSLEDGKTMILMYSNTGTFRSVEEKLPVQKSGITYYYDPQGNTDNVTALYRILKSSMKNKYDWERMDYVLSLGLGGFSAIIDFALWAAKIKK